MVESFYKELVRSYYKDITDYEIVCRKWARLHKRTVEQFQLLVILMFIVGVAFGVTITLFIQQTFA